MDRRDHGGATDTDLTIQASRGDDDAFAELYARYAGRITGYLVRLVHDEHLAQDLTHEVFVSALRRLRNDRPPIAVGPWLYRIARNASIDVHRRTQVVRHVPLDGAGEETARSGALDSAPEAAAEVNQWIEHLRYLLDGLSDTHRTVLVLRELEGLSNAEIGERLGVSRPAVEGLLFRARTKVRAEYEELISGRRCETVRETLDRAGAHTRLGRRDARAASRHLRVCGPCRRHAWEAGVVAVVHGRAAATRAVLPVPAGLIALADRLHGAFRGLAEAPHALAPWGRAAAAVTAMVVAGTAVAPHVARPAEAPRTPERVAVAAAPPASPAPTPAASAASPAAAPTVLPVRRGASLRRAPAAPGDVVPATAPVALPPAERAEAEPPPAPEPATRQAAEAPAPAPVAETAGAEPAGDPAHEKVAEMVGTSAGRPVEAIASLVGEAAAGRLPEKAAAVAEIVAAAKEAVPAPVPEPVAEPPAAPPVEVPLPLPAPEPPPVAAPDPAPIPVPEPPKVEAPVPVPEPPAPPLPDARRAGPVSLR